MFNQIHRMKKKIQFFCLQPANAGSRFFVFYSKSPGHSGNIEKMYVIWIGLDETRIYMRAKKCIKNT